MPILKKGSKKKSILEKVADKYYNPKKVKSGINKRGTPYQQVVEVYIDYKKNKGYYTKQWDIPYGRRYFKSIQAVKNYSRKKTTYPIRFYWLNPTGSISTRYTNVAGTHYLTDK